jgi:hypothetical protein
MKNLPIILLSHAVLLFGLTASAQESFNSALNDAIKLRSIDQQLIESRSHLVRINVDNGIDKNAILLILNNYTKSRDERSIVNEINSNPFFNLSGDLDQLSSGTKISKISYLTSLGTMDVTNFAYGMTDFLIDRAKTELNIAFFQRFKEEMTKKEYKDLQLLFPQTYQMLLAIGDQIFYYNQFIQGLRHAFETDLRRMPYQISAWVDTQQGVIDTTVFNVIKLGLLTSNSILENKHPGAILKDLSEEVLRLNKKEQDKQFQTFESIIRLVAMISESFRDTLGANDYWVDASEIRQLTNDDVLLRIYLGLLYQQIKLDTAKFDISFNDEITLLTILDAIGGNWTTNGPAAKRLISTICMQINLTQNWVFRYSEAMRLVKYDKGLSGRDRNQTLFNAYYDIATSMLDVLRNTGMAMNAFAVNINTTDTVFGKKLLKMFPADSLTKINDEFLAKVDAAYKIGVYAFNKQYAGAVTQGFLLLMKASKDKEHQWQMFLEYGTFMANMVAADSPEAITAAIDAAALPPGSYSIKRHSRFNVSLNGYLGGFFGTEIMSGVKTNIGNNLSVTAPVGIYLGWGQLCQRSRNPGSLGLYISVIDLGTVASFRFKGDSISALPTINLYHIFAPGASFEFGIPSTPISLSYGVQIGPRLRKVDPALDTQIGDFYWRHGFSIKVDIPIFTFTSITAKR